MKKVQYEEMFPWEIANAMQATPLIYLPLGTLEWHGEHNAAGLDAMHYPHEHAAGGETSLSMAISHERNSRN